MDKLANKLDRELGFPIPEVDRQCLWNAFSFLELSLQRNMSQDMTYMCPSVDEYIRGYFDIVDEMKSVYATYKWVSLARCQLYPIFHNKIRGKSYYNEDQALAARNPNANRDEEFTSIVWQYLLAVLYHIACQNLYKRLLEKLNQFHISYQPSQLDVFGSISEPIAYVVKEYLEFLPIYCEYVPVHRTLISSYNAYDIFSDLHYIIRGNYNSRWTEEQVQLLSMFSWKDIPAVVSHVITVTDTFQTMTDYGGCNTSVAVPIINFILRDMEKRRIM